MKTYITIILISLTTVLLSCSTENTPVYLLNTSIEPAGSGIVTPGQGEFEKGDTVRISATANNDWVFAGWTGDYTGTGNSVVITMDRDKTISALFAIKEYPLTVEIEGEGTVNETVVQQKTTDYQAGTTVELTAVASEGWYFSQWEGDLGGTQNPVMIDIDNEKSVTVVFERIDYALTINVEGKGTVSEEAVQAKVADYPYQTIVKLTAISSEGWVFSHWAGDITGEENPAEIEVTEAKEVTAVFVRDYFDVTISLGDGYGGQGAGSIIIDLLSGNREGDRFEYESEIRVTIGGTAGNVDVWQFSHWEGDLSGTENPIQVSVTSDVTATAITKIVD